MPSPIRVPLPVDGFLRGEDNKVPFDQAKEIIESGIRDACGNNELCVQVVKIADRDDDNNGGPQCDGVSYVVGQQEDAGGGYVDTVRGGEIEVAVDVPCEDLTPARRLSNSPGGSGSDGDSTVGDTDTNELSGT